MLFVVRCSRSIGISRFAARRGQCLDQICKLSLFDAELFVFYALGLAEAALIGQRLLEHDGLHIEFVLHRAKQLDFGQRRGLRLVAGRFLPGRLLRWLFGRLRTLLALWLSLDQSVEQVLQTSAGGGLCLLRAEIGLRLIEPTGGAGHLTLGACER